MTQVVSSFENVRSCTHTNPNRDITGGSVAIVNTHYTIKLGVADGSLIEPDIT